MSNHAAGRLLDLSSPSSLSRYSLTATARLDPPSGMAAMAEDETVVNSRRLQPRWEVFEHGLLPIPKLIFGRGDRLQVRTIDKLKKKLAAKAIERRVNATAVGRRVDAAALAEALEIPQEQAALVLRTLAAVLPAEDSALGDGAGAGAAADIRDVLLFLCIQPYKAPLSSGRGTGTSTSAASALSPANQLVCSNSHRFMPPQADEETHQLSYLQKHMENIITLLAESVKGDGNGSLVLTMDTFEHLGFLVQFSEGTSLSQASNLFANSPDMPAAPVPTAQVSDWIKHNITSSPESNHQTVSDLDVTMSEANTSHPRNRTPSGNPAYYRNITFVEGFSETSIVKHASDVKGKSIKVLNCHNSNIFILAPLKYATVHGCSNATIVLGAVGKVVKVDNCQRVCITATAKSICIANCRECIFYLGVNHQPIVLGTNHNLRVAPFNTGYPQLGDHMKQVGIDPSVNKWDQAFDPRDSVSYAAGVSHANAESTIRLDPDLFTIHSIHNCFWSEMQVCTNPFPLPEIYTSVLNKKGKKATCLSLDVYLKSAKKVDTDRGLSKNQLVEQFYVPWNGAQNHMRVRYTPEGYSIIGGLISHVTNTHLNKKSWDGKITADMFFVCQGQIHIHPWAIAKKVVSPDACWRDLYALINNLIWNASELILPNNNTKVYPLHLKNLCTNLEKISVEKRRNLAMSSKIATYIRCNPAFLSHSQKSCICWHLRRFELSRSAPIRQHFKKIIEGMHFYDHWFSKFDGKHRLFCDTFTDPEKKRPRYEDSSYDFYRFVRDWHTHCLEPTRDTDPDVKKRDARVKSNYGFEVLESIAEIHFDSYLSDILFNLVCDEKIDIVAWLSDLKPALPIQSQDSNPQNKKYKGG